MSTDIDRPLCVQNFTLLRDQNVRRDLGRDELSHVFEFLEDCPKTLAACCLLCTSLHKPASSVLYCHLRLKVGSGFNLDSAFNSASLPHNRIYVRRISVHVVLNADGEFIPPDIAQLQMCLQNFENLTSAGCVLRGLRYVLEQDYVALALLTTFCSRPKIRNLSICFLPLQVGKRLSDILKRSLHKLSVTGTPAWVVSNFFAGPPLPEYDLELKVLDLDVNSDLIARPLSHDEELFLFTSIADSLHRFQKLESLTFHGGFYDFTNNHLFSLLSQLSRLQVLNLCIHFPYQEADYNPGFHLTRPRSLRAVYLGFRPIGYESPLPAGNLCQWISWIIHDSPLEVLRVSIDTDRLQGDAGCEILIDEIVERHGDTLEKLDLPSRMCLRRDVFKKLLRGCPYLEYLHVGIGGRECLATFIRQSARLRYLRTVHFHCRDLNLNIGHQRWLVSCNAEEILETMKHLELFSINQREWKRVRVSDENGEPSYQLKIVHDFWPS
ncbi:hypothetical protein WG66_005962 [Moniliophthora roreri]|uniref:F-box domain-containing protein n=1 Tax=Moniliophthora roreri TaxID=221103 RepID=A0A0W0GEJ6_MONRR|nr:hypothetical protein WG66_005962 [Moniliophthora roreri]